MWEKLAERVAERVIEKKLNELMGNTAGNLNSGKSKDNPIGNNPWKTVDPKTGQEKPRGSIGWDDKRLGLLPFKKESAILDIALPITGDVAKATGNILGNNASLLGAALQAMKIGSGNTLTGDTMNNMGLAGAAGYAAKGMNEKLIGDIAANRLYDIAGTLKTERAQARNKAYQINEQAPGLFWQEQRKNAPTASGFEDKKKE